MQGGDKRKKYNFFKKKSNMDSFLAGTKKKKASAYALEPICVCAIVLGICKPHE